MKGKDYLNLALAFLICSIISIVVTIGFILVAAYNEEYSKIIKYLVFGVTTYVCLELFTRFFARIGVRLVKHEEMMEDSPTDSKYVKGLKNVYRRIHAEKEHKPTSFSERLKEAIKAKN